MITLIELCSDMYEYNENKCSHVNISCIYSKTVMLTATLVPLPTRLHCVIFQKSSIFIVIAMGTSKMLYQSCIKFLHKMRKHLCSCYLYGAELSLIS